MMIYKYPLRQVPIQTIDMPAGAKILCAQTQKDVPTLWAEVDEAKDSDGRVILIAATGAILTGLKLDYIGTCLINNGQYVWHVYEKFNQ